MDNCTLKNKLDDIYDANTDICGVLKIICSTDLRDEFGDEIAFIDLVYRQLKESTDELERIIRDI